MELLVGQSDVQAIQVEDLHRLSFPVIELVGTLEDIEEVELHAFDCEGIDTLVFHQRCPPVVVPEEGFQAG